MEPILVDQDGEIATLRFNRPDAMNALTPDMLVQAADAMAALGADPTVRVIVITGAGRAFSAGVDLKALGAVELVDGMVGDILDLPARRLIELIVSAPQPVIASVNGHCYTGALEIALACDLLLIADEATVGDTHAKWGLRPTWGMSQRLPRRVGWQRARELSYTARSLRGAEAAALGLALCSVPRAELDERVAMLCRDICANSAQSIAAYKDLYRHTETVPLAQGLAVEFENRYPISDSMQRLAAFLER